MEKTTLILGASSNPQRASYEAIRRLRRAGIKTYAIGLREAKVYDVEIVTGHPSFDDKIHTVSLYLGPKNQEEHIQYILSLSPVRIIFNPGTFNADLEEEAINAGIEVIDACMLTMLGDGGY
ncbi:MAG: CoA-binding protein [Bacteroidales bacterium]